MENSLSSGGGMNRIINKTYTAESTYAFKFYEFCFHVSVWIIFIEAHIFSYDVTLWTDTNTGTIPDSYR